MGAPRLHPTSQVSLHPLAVQPEDGEFVVGRVDIGVFTSLPEIGTRALGLLREGSSLAETEVQGVRPKTSRRRRIPPPNFRDPTLGHGAVHGEGNQRERASCADLLINPIGANPPQIVRRLGHIGRPS